MKPMAYPSAPGSTGAGDPAGAGGDDRRAEARDGHRSPKLPFYVVLHRARWRHEEARRCVGTSGLRSVVGGAR